MAVGEGQFVNRRAAVGQQERAPAGIELVLEQRLRVANFVQKDVLRGIGREAHEVGLRYARLGFQHLGQRLLHQTRLVEVDVFGVQRRRAWWRYAPKQTGLRQRFVDGPQQRRGGNGNGQAPWHVVVDLAHHQTHHDA